MENELFVVRYYWTLMWRRPLNWLLPMLAVIAIGTYVVLQQPRTYSSTARVAVQAPEDSSNLVQSTVSSERIQFFEQRVFSRDNLVAIADKLQMFPALRQTLPEGQIADLVRRQITLQIVPTEPTTPVVTTTPASNSAILAIAFQSGTAEDAAAGANEVVNLLIAESRKTRISEASQMRSFLEQEVADRKREVEALDDERAAFDAKSEALLPSRMPLYTLEINELQQELQTIQTASASLAADTRVLESQLALTSLPSGAESQLAELRNELATKLTSFSDTHPEIISLRARIDTLEKNIVQMGTAPANPEDQQVTAQTSESAMLSGRVVSAQQQQEDFQKRRTEINERLKWLRDTIAQMPTVETSLNSLQRRQNSAEQKLADMQARLETATVSERLETARQDSQIRVIDQPEVPVYPSGSGRTQAMLIVAVLAVFSGLAGLVGFNLLNRTIKGKRDLVSIIDGGSIALIPEWKPRGSKKFSAKFQSAAVLLAVTGATAYTANLPPKAILSVHSQHEVRLS